MEPLHVDILKDATTTSEVALIKETPLGVATCILWTRGQVGCALRTNKEEITHLADSCLMFVVTGCVKSLNGASETSRRQKISRISHHKGMCGEIAVDQGFLERT